MKVNKRHWLTVALGMLMAGSAAAQTQSETVLKAGTTVKKQSGNDAREKTLREAEALMKAGKPGEAYQLLEPSEFERSGEVRFDYLLGIAALDSGKADKATLAFERVLAVEPNFAGARLDMARAYFQLGDIQRAKTEFEEVLKQNPPEAARITIQKYLDEIAAYERAKQTRMTAYVEGVFGLDGNIASGSSSALSVSPSSTWFNVFPNNKLANSPILSDFYGGANAGGEISHSLNANWSVFAGGDLRQHNNMIVQYYDTTGETGRAGVMYANEQNSYKLTVTYGGLDSGNTMHTDMLNLSTEYQHSLNPSNQLSAFAQYGQGRASGYQAADTTHTNSGIEGNLDQYTLGTGLVHILADGKTALFGSVSAGNEFAVGGRADGNRFFYGARIGGQTPLSDKWDGVASLGWQASAFSIQNTLIADTRREQLSDLSVGANWHWDKQWTVKPQLAYSTKITNVQSYCFDRTDVSLTIRRDFQ